MFENLLVAAVFGRGSARREVTDACGEVLERTGLLAAPIAVPAR